MPEISNVTVSITNNRHQMLTIEDGMGVIDRAAKIAFTEGQCHALAIAFHDATGWPIIGIGGDPDSPSHFVVYDPKIDDFVDIGGPKAFTRDWGEHRYMLKEFTRDEAIQPEFYQKADIKAAIPFVKTLMEQLDSLPEVKPKLQGLQYLDKTF